MKKIFLKSALIFVGVLAGVSFVGFLLGAWVLMSKDHCEPPCHGAAMAAGFVWILGFEASLILAFIAAMATAVYLRLKQ